MSTHSEEPLASVHSLKARRKRGVSMTQWPTTIVLIGVALSLVVVAFWSFRKG